MPPGPQPLGERAMTPADQQWLDALPESLADTPAADARRAVCDLDLSGLEIDPPRGFGRD